MNTRLRLLQLDRRYAAPDACRDLPVGPFELGRPRHVTAETACPPPHPASWLPARFRQLQSTPASACYPGADTAALQTLELLVEEKVAGALPHARTWTRHERINGALLDEWLARRRLGQVLHRSDEHEQAVAQLVRAGARDLAVAAAWSAAYVDMSRHLGAIVGARTQAAAAAVVKVQAHLLPDEIVTEVSAALLAIVENRPRSACSGRHRPSTPSEPSPD